MKHISYPKIGQFRNLCKDIEKSFGYRFDGDEWVRDLSYKLPTLKFTGTTKIHGTCSSVVVSSTSEQYIQSRTRTISIEKDNSGFAAWAHSKQSYFLGIRVSIELQFPEIVGNDIAIFGEWAGQGIQKGVAVNSVEKFFYVFGVKVVTDDEESNYWLKDYIRISSKIHRIVDKRDFEQFSIEIDFNYPQLQQNKLIDMTMKVEAMCPVGAEMAKRDGVELQSTIGEGIVYEHIDDTGKMYQMKIKGDKHSTSKVKKLASVDPEKVNSIREFVDYAVTENRLEQAYVEVCNSEFDIKLMGAFIKWMSSDIIKEESDVLSKNGLCMKDVGSSLSRKAKQWYFERGSL